MKNKEKGKNLLLFFIALIIGLVLIAIGVYYILNKEEKTPMVQKEPLTDEEITEITKEVMDLYYVKIPNSLPVIPIVLDNHDEIVSYKENVLSPTDKANIIFNYIFLYRDKYCDEDYHCQIKVEELNSKVGLVINDTFKENEYVQKISEIDGEAYYNVVMPVTGFKDIITVNSCKTNYNVENRELDVVCSIVKEDINGESVILGSGTFTYTLLSELSFNRFTFTRSE